MQEPLKLGAVLLVITTICGGLLGFVNARTAPIIAQGKEKAQQVAVQQLLPLAKEMEEVEVTDVGKLTTVFVTYDSGTYIGAVAKVYPDGFGGSIELLVGMHADGTLAGVQVLTHAETPGLGANMTQDAFKNQFKDQQTPLGVSKTTSGDGEIMAITGATITSRAVVDGVNEATAYMKAHQAAWEKGEY
ncbi:MAG: RnfABCDGE type electron transport complex subunit G [Niameybacter sp.]|uniref:RnfABCDGE type electron transport complex subunit G n=1 Tax=Niameybacter sp. TaxID=2033640 RepID=UPI002FC5C107